MFAHRRCRANRIAFDNLIVNSLMVITDLLQSPVSRRCRKAPHHLQVAQTVDKVGKASITGGPHNDPMKASVQLKMLSCAGVMNLVTKAIHPRPQLPKFSRANLLRRAISRGNFKKQPQREYLFEIIHGCFQNSGTSVSLEPNHALICQLE